MQGCQSRLKDSLANGENLRYKVENLTKLKRKMQSNIDEFRAEVKMHKRFKANKESNWLSSSKTKSLSL